MYLTFCYFFFNDTATTEIYTLSLHDALPISSPSSPATPSTPTPIRRPRRRTRCSAASWRTATSSCRWRPGCSSRSEEHTSELQSRRDLVCRLLLEKKKSNNNTEIIELARNLR